MEIITEGSKIFLQGIITESNDCFSRPRNRNGRIYPDAVLKPSVENLIKRVLESKVYSYRNHPNHSNLIYKDSAGVFEELKWDDNSKRAFGKLEILKDTKDGKQVLEDLDKGLIYGISTRAIGSLDENKIVLPGLKIITADLIPIIESNGYNSSIQSCQNCTLSLTENIQEYYDDFLIDESCGCVYESLTELEKSILSRYTVNKISEKLRNK